jgi:hypothetical protein
MQENDPMMETARILLMARIEGSFAEAFLLAFIRADSENRAILTEPFIIFSEKFTWDEKVAALKKRGLK